MSWGEGPRGGFGRPGQGASARLADVLRRARITSLQRCDRSPNVLPACALDVLAGVVYLTQGGAPSMVRAGHSCGGAVVMTAGAVHDHVAGVVAVGAQTYGAPRGVAGTAAAPRGAWEADTRLPYPCDAQMDDWAQEPKQLVLFEGAEHRLDACAAALD